MEFIFFILAQALTIFYWIIIIQVVLSWLIAFDVINIRNAQAQNIVGLINKITEPVYRPLRRFIPPIAGIDITPIIVIFGVIIIRDSLLPQLYGFIVTS